MAAAAKISFYILGSIIIIALIVLIVTIFKLPEKVSEKASEKGSERASAIFGTPPPSICGLGTSFDAGSGVCKPDEGELINLLVDSGNIRINYDNTIYYDPKLQFTEIVPAPRWYTKWVDVGGPLVCKTSFVATDPFAGSGEKTILDVNMKYAGVFENKTCCFKYPNYDSTNTCFVNNNITSFEQAAEVRNTQQYNVENITFIFSPDVDRCKQGYCYINGICVSPYEVTFPIDSACCPPCIYTPTSKGGCAGQFACDDSNPCKKERKVEYPGTQIKCSQSIATSPQCTATSKSSDECWSSDNADQSKRQPYKYIEAGFENICTEVTLCDSFNGKNEFDCALSCIDDKLTQKQCSQRCLPKLWRWYPVFAKTAGQTKTFRGFMQSDELMQDIQDPIPPLLYCPPDTCVYERDFGKDPRLTRCTDCTGCVVRRNEDRLEDNIYTCNKCKQCLLDITDVDSGDCGDQTKTLVCENFNSCSSCKNKEINPNPFFKVSEDICDQCSTKDINQSCKFYTRVPYINDTLGGKITLRPEVKIYNCGGTQPVTIP